MGMIRKYSLLCSSLSQSINPRRARVTVHSIIPITEATRENTEDRVYRRRPTYTGMERAMAHHSCTLVTLKVSEMFPNNSQSGLAAGVARM